MVGCPDEQKHYVGGKSRENYHLGIFNYRLSACADLGLEGWLQLHHNTALGAEKILILFLGYD